MNLNNIKSIFLILSLICSQGCYLFCLFKEDPLTEQLIDHIIHDSIFDGENNNNDGEKT